MDTQLDILCRLQTLEGVFGIPAGTWSRRLDLRKARSFVQDHGAKLFPTWLVDTDTGFYRHAWDQVNGVTKNPADTDDVVQTALSNQTLYQMGERCATDILAGRKGLRGVYFGTHGASGFLRNRAIDVLRRDSRNDPLPRTWDTLDDREPTRLAEGFLIRDNIPKMRAVLAESKGNHRVIRLWLDTWEKDDEFITLTEMSKVLGVSVPAVRTQLINSFNYMAPCVMVGWEEDFHGLWRR